MAPVVVEAIDAPPSPRRPSVSKPEPHEPGRRRGGKVHAFSLTCTAVNKWRKLNFDPGKCIWDLCEMKTPPPALPLSSVLQPFHFEDSIWWDLFSSLAHLYGVPSSSMFQEHQKPMRSSERCIP